MFGNNSVRDEDQITIACDLNEGEHYHFMIVVNGIKIPMKISVENLTDGTNAIELSTLRLLDQRVRWVDCSCEKMKGSININVRR